MPFINKTKKFIFVGNARCGSTSMYKKLAELFDKDEIIWETGRKDIKNPDDWKYGIVALPWLYHMGIEETLGRYPFAKDYFKFCFVRNPWSRVLSFYREFKKPRHQSWSHPILRYRSFEEFCIDFNNCPLKNDIHFVSNYRQATINEKIHMDFIGRFENIEEDFSKVISNFTENAKLDVHERNTGTSNYRDHYNNQTRKIIEEFYKEDVENFGYEF